MSQPFGHSQPPVNRRGFPVKEMLVSAGAYHVMGFLGPVTYSIVEDGVILHLPALAGAVCVIKGMQAAEWGLNHLAERMEYLLAKLPVGRKGTAAFATRREALKVMKKYDWGPYFGVLLGGRLRKNREMIVPYESVAVTIGPSGSGKTTKALLTNTLSIKDSKFILDFKGDLTHQLYDTLSQTENVIVLDLGGLFENHPTIKTASYNPLSNVMDCLKKQGGILDLKNTVKELIQQLYPDLPTGNSDPFWPNGSREILEVIIIYAVLLYGDGGHLGHAEAWLNDPETLKTDMRYAAGQATNAQGEPLPAMSLEDTWWATDGTHDAGDVTNFIAWLRRKAGMLAKALSADDSKMIESFLSGARQQFSDFSIISRSFKVTSTSTFRFSQMKEGDRPTTVFVVLDATKPTTQNRLSAIIQWCAFNELKSHENKHQRKVYFQLDEVGNAKVEGMDTLMTYARSYGILLHLYIQNIAAFCQTYGDFAVKILVSEAQVIQCLPGVQEKETIELIQSLLGETSVMGTSYNHDHDQYGIKGKSYQEDTMPLLTDQQIRHAVFTLLFVRGHKPILTYTPPVFAIMPFARQLAPNPHYGTKQRIDKTVLRIGHRRPPVFLRIIASLSSLMGGRS